VGFLWFTFNLIFYEAPQNKISKLQVGPTDSHHTLQL